MKTTIEQQKEILTNVAVELLQKGQDFKIVNDYLNQYVINSRFDRDINVDAIRYLAKCKLGLI
jgi:hypothetical protein